MSKNLMKVLGYIASVPFALALVFTVVFIIAPLTMISHICPCEFSDTFNDGVNKISEPVLELLGKLGK